MSAEQNQTTKLSPEHENRLREAMTKFSIPEETQNSLIQKKEDGELWDSEKRATPTSIESVITESGPTEIQHFQDGSLISISAPGIYATDMKPEAGNIATPLATGQVSECDDSADGTSRIHTSCLILLNDLNSVLTFRADYWDGPDGFGGITNVYAPGCSTAGGNMSMCKLTIINDRSTSTTAARAILEYKFDGIGDVAGAFGTVTLAVTGDGPSVYS